VNRPVGRALALLLAVVGVAAALEAWRDMPLGSADDPGPGALPLVIGGVVAGLGLATALTRTWPVPAPLARGRALAVAAAIVGWVLALPLVGFGVAAVAAMVVLGRAVSPVPLGRLLVFAVLLGGTTTLVFRGLLALPLPRGPWGW
jgi:putative tricarboxylic transport membrane protein